MRTYVLLVSLIALSGCAHDQKKALIAAGKACLSNQAPQDIVLIMCTNAHDIDEDYWDICQSKAELKFNLLAKVWPETLIPMSDTNIMYEADGLTFIGKAPGRRMATLRDREKSRVFITPVCKRAEI